MLRCRAVFIWSNYWPLSVGVGNSVWQDGDYTVGIMHPAEMAECIEICSG